MEGRSPSSLQLFCSPIFQRSCRGTSSDDGKSFISLLKPRLWLRGDFKIGTERRVGSIGGGTEGANEILGGLLSDSDLSGLFRPKILRPGLRLDFLDAPGDDLVGDLDKNLVGDLGGVFGGGVCPITKLFFNSILLFSLDGVT